MTSLSHLRSRLPGRPLLCRAAGRPLPAGRRAAAAPRPPAGVGLLMALMLAGGLILAKAALWIGDLDSMLTAAPDAAVGTTAGPPADPPAVGPAPPAKREVATPAAATAVPTPLASSLPRDPAQGESGVALPEPAAGPPDGPDATVASSDDDGAVTGAPARRSPAPLNVARLTRSEIEVLYQLAARREALEERAAALDQREALLAVAEARVGEEADRLIALREEIEATMARRAAEEDAEIAQLVKIYETMKPKAAAEIFDRLEMPVLLQVVARMREATSAEVLARMTPAKAEQVTAALAERDAPPAGAPDD